MCQKLCDYGDVFGIGYINAESVHVDTRSKVNIWFGDETNGVSLIKQGYTNFNDYFNGKRLIVNSGTWNVRSLPNISGRIITVVNGGSTYRYNRISNGWAYLTEIGGWISPKGFSIKK